MGEKPSTIFLDNSGCNMAKAKLGSGKRFAAIASKATKEYGSKEAGERVAAFIGRKKYGAKRMAKLSAAGRKK